MRGGDARLDGDADARSPTVGLRRAADAGHPRAAHRRCRPLRRQRADLRCRTPSPGAWRRSPRHPELALGGPACSWTARRPRGDGAAGRRAAADLPMLVLLGTDEIVVSPAAIRTQVRARCRAARLLDAARRPPRGLHGAAGDPRAVWRRIDDVPGGSARAERPCGGGPRVVRRGDRVGRPEASSGQATSLRTRARSNSRRRCASGIA